jgi:hypothetical protein
MVDLVYSKEELAKPRWPNFLGFPHYAERSEEATKYKLIWPGGVGPA